MPFCPGFLRSYLFFGYKFGPFVLEMSEKPWSFRLQIQPIVVVMSEKSQIS